MKRSLGLVCVGLVLALSVMACRFVEEAIAPVGTEEIFGSGSLVQESRPVSGFNAINLTGNGEMIVEITEEDSIILEAESNLMPYLVSEVRSGSLVVGVEPGVDLRPTLPVRFYVTAKMLEGLTVSGSGDMRAGYLDTAQLALSTSGSGDLHIEDMNSEDLIVEIGGSGDIEIGSGQVFAQRVVIDGSGDYRAAELISEEAQVEINGSGDAEIWVLKVLGVRINGNGDVEYYGNPVVSVETLGNGALIQRGEK